MSIRGGHSHPLIEIDERLQINKNRQGSVLGRLIAFPSSSNAAPALTVSWPRLLTLAQAAAYCGLTASAFIRLCPVESISPMADPQDDRFDRHELDAWIDGNCEHPEKNGWKNWLALMEGKQP